MLISLIVREIFCKDILSDIDTFHGEFRFNKADVRHIDGSDKAMFNEEWDLISWVSNIVSHF